MDISHEFAGPNLGYVIELYDRYRKDPLTVDAATRAYFEKWGSPDGDGRRGADGGATAGTAPPAETEVATAVAAPATGAPRGELPAGMVAGVVNLASAIRSYGHLAARLDPLGSASPGDPALNPATHGLADDALSRLPGSLVDVRPAQAAGSALEALQRLRAIYCANIGHEYEHIRQAEERAWLHEAAESGRYGSPGDPIDGGALLERLTQVEAFERFLQRAFPGKTRFSIEGVDMLVPVLDQVIGCAAERNICTIFIGMAHRGRLNVLAHVLQKPYAQLLTEFRDPVAGHNLAIRDDLGWTGDVKYHKGAQRALTAEDEAGALLVTMPPNPSHLEYINPVVEGMARAADTGMDRPGAPVSYECAALPILVHGDAAFSGQGVVAETLNLSQLAGYCVAGTIHIITNNQLGFTTPPACERSTWYASDLAKGFNIPVIHVNADDPEACIEAARIAFAYRDRFQKDFLIDMVGYRRYGHNEGDEPSFTQPKMYAQIATHPTVRALWATRLVQEGLVEPEAPDRMLRERTEELQRELEGLAPDEQIIEPQLQPAPRGLARRVKTAVPADRLRAINTALAEIAGRVKLNPRLERSIRRRRSALEHENAPEIDWGTAEELALASILADGTPSQANMV